MKTVLSKVLFFIVLGLFLTTGDGLAWFSEKSDDMPGTPTGVLGGERDKSLGLKRNVPSSFSGMSSTKSKSKYKDGELLVKFKENVPEHGKDNLHKKHGSGKIKEFRELRLHHLKLKKGISVEEAVQLYREDPTVEYAEPNYLYTAQTLPNDPRFGELWGLHNTGQTSGTANADINAPEAWNITTGSSDVVVAVIDSGIDYTHPDLAANMWRNTGEIAGNGIDDDNNGQVDDVYGIDTFNEDGNPMDDNGHGTHVAGTIGAIGNNDVGVAGVNWNVKIIGCKFLDKDGYGSTDGAVECLEYIKTLKDKGINIVATNNSWGGGGYSQALYDAIDAQKQSGILFLAAAGNNYSDNDKYDYYPANYDLPNLIAVAATDHSDAKADFSDFGRRKVHVGAPGASILSTLPGQNKWGITGGYGLLSGTSMATPHVTGLSALLKAQQSGRDWKAIRNLILAGGDNISAMQRTTITGKRINAYGALNCTNSPVFSILKYPVTITVGTPVTLSALSINCSSSAGPVTVTLSGGEVITLHDNGTAPDLAAGDGIFTGTWTPSGEVERLIFSSPAGTETVVTPELIISPYIRQGNLRAPSYDHTLTAKGGLPPYSWSIVSGSLPAGLSLDETTGRISGQVTAGSQTPLTVQVTDALNMQSTKDLLLNIVDVPAVEEWVRTYTYSNNEAGFATAVDSSGNIYVTGHSNSCDFLIVKYDPSGNLLWNRTYDSGTCDRAYAIAVDKSDDIYVGGIYAAGAYDIRGLIVKYDSAGNVLWTRGVQIGCTSFSLAVDGDNNVYAISSSTVKFDSSGNQIWEKAFPDILEHGYTRCSTLVTADDSNNVYVTGLAWKYYDNEGYADYNLTVKYDPDGNELWVRHFNPGGLATIPGGMAVDNKNVCLYIAGVPLYNTPGMIKYDLEGNFQWFRPEGAAFDVAVDDIGNIYLGSLYLHDKKYDYSARTRKYDANFNLLWEQTYETMKSEVVRDIAVDKTGNVYAVGQSQDDYFGFLAIKYSGRDSLAIIKSPPPSGISGSSYSHTLTAAGGKTPYSWSIFSGSLPGGLSLDSATGVISGIVASAGTFHFTAQVTDANSVTARNDFSIYVHLIGITTSTLPAGSIGTPYSQALTASGGEAPYTWTIYPADALPNGLSLNSSTGLISGTATSDGTFFFTVGVREASGMTTEKELSITINCPLRIDTISLPGGPVSTPYSQSVRAIGGKAPYSWSLTTQSSLPPGLTLNSSTGVISGTPTTAGAFNFSVQVRDALDKTATKALSIAISPPHIVTPSVDSHYAFDRMWPRLDQPWYFTSPAGIAADASGNIFFSDTLSHSIQKFSSGGAYLTQWGSLGSGNGQFIFPYGITADSSGNVYVAAPNNNRIQKFDSNGIYLMQWGTSGSGNGQFQSPYGIAVDSSGNVYVADTNNHRIQKFDSNGTYLTQWGSYGSGNGQIIYSKGIAVDSSGNIYVADGNNRIQKFDSNGSYLAQWGSYGSGDGQFKFSNSLIVGIAVDSSGNAYVTDTGNHRIQKFSSSGAYLTQWGPSGSGNGQFNNPEDISVDSSGNVYVADTDNNRIQKFSSSGAYVTQWGSGNGQLSRPSGIAVDSSGNVYVADGGNHRILKFSPSGTYILQWGSYGSGNGQFMYPTDIAVDSSGNVYVVDNYNNIIQKFNSNGIYLKKWGSYGLSNGQFNGPRSITVDSLGNVYVADTNNNRIQKFNSSGTYLTQWGTSGSGNGQFQYPYGIAVDSSGNVYVADTSNNRIQKFSSSGTYLTQWGSWGSGNGQFNKLYGIAADASGKVYVADSGNYRIQKFSYYVGGRLTPSTPQSVIHNSTVSFTAMPDTGFHTLSATGCGGTLSGDTFTTGPVTADCTVTATFAINTHTVTPVAGTGGSLSPSYSQTVNYGATTGFTVKPNTGHHIISVTGCGAAMVEPQAINVPYSFTTGPITADCTVTATFSDILNVLTSSLPFGTVGAAYSQTLIATGGKSPYTWTRTSGNLPPGLTLNSSTGEISGDFKTTGSWSFTVQVKDIYGTVASRGFNVTVDGLGCTVPTMIEDTQEGQIIRKVAMEIVENLVFSSPMSVVLKGGYDCGFISNPWNTTIIGAIRVTDGTVKIESIVLR